MRTQILVQCEFFIYFEIIQVLLVVVLFLCNRYSERSGDQLNHMMTQHGSVTWQTTAVQFKQCPSNSSIVLPGYCMGICTAQFWCIRQVIFRGIPCVLDG